jgi:DNA-directed RNA polymerase specialized sigma24 family protein
MITEYQDRIYRLYCSYIADDEIRKDLYQNILIRLWRGMDLFWKRHQRNHQPLINNIANLLKELEEKKRYII